MQASAQSASVSTSRLDPDRVKPHHSGRLLTVPEGAVPCNPTETTAILDTTPEAISARRKAVERVVELYVAVEDEPQSVKLNAAVLVALKAMDFRAARDIRGLYTTIGWVLRRMERACGPCRAARTVGCLHVNELKTSARLKHLIASGRGLADTCSKQLGSETTRRQMEKAHVRIATKRRAQGNSQAEFAARERGSIIRRASYAEACELFYLACCLDATVRLIVFREMS